MEYECPPELLGQRLIRLDIETTGLDMRLNNIIELGVVEVVDGREKRRYGKLFGGGRSSAHLIKSVHGIRDADRRGKPTFRESCGKIADYLMGAVIVTHNGAKFDLPFMEYQMKQVGVFFTYAKHYDTCVMSRSLRKPVLDANGVQARDEEGNPAFEPLYERHSLEYMCGVFGIPYGEENHRGLQDCWCTMQLLFALIGKHKELA